VGADLTLESALEAVGTFGFGFGFGFSFGSDDVDVDEEDLTTASVGSTLLGLRSPTRPLNVGCTAPMSTRDVADAIVFPTRDVAALIVRASRWLRQSARMNPKISPIVTGRRTPMAHLSTRLPRVSNTVYFVITIVRLTWA
jgi:hypothetical protein